ncbi:hypothetical protein [Mucilaginibacter gracilis]|nr:hypothetical protein [Mucilaginibacter gracilis]
MGDIGISRSTLEKSRVKLKSLGLIDFVSVNGTANITWTINDLRFKNAGTQAANQKGKQASAEGAKYTGNGGLNKDKIKTKLNQNIYREFEHLAISVDEFDLLIDLGYSKHEIDEIIDAVHNYKDNKKYTSLYLTVKNWLGKNAEQTKKTGKKSTDTPAKSDDKKLVNKSIEAFETYKSKGLYTDWDNIIYDFLHIKSLIVFADNDNRLPEIIELDKAGRLPEAKQIALIAYFHDLAEAGRELKDLLN